MVWLRGSFSFFEMPLLASNTLVAFAKATGAKVVLHKDLPSGESCPICLDDFCEEDDESKDEDDLTEVIKMKSCTGIFFEFRGLLLQGHFFHTECIFPIWKRGYLICPICQSTYGVRTGNMPNGTMRVEFTQVPLNGNTRVLLNNFWRCNRC